MQRLIILFAVLFKPRHGDRDKGSQPGCCPAPNAGLRQVVPLDQPHRVKPVIGRYDGIPNLAL